MDYAASILARLPTRKRAIGLDGLVKKIQGYLPPEQVALVLDAYHFAAEAHQGQKRKTGEPYISHPVSVADILADLRLDSQTLMAALLHDVIEDTGIDKDQLADRFGEEVAELVDGVSKLDQIEFRSRAEAQAESFRKMLLAMVGDIRVILVKLADRTHNMRTLWVMPPGKRRRIARETLEIYAPIALRLGMNSIKLELEDLGFRALYPHRYRVLERSMRRGRAQRQVLERIRKRFNETLKDAEIPGVVEAREKHLYSIYRKMRRKDRGIEALYDIRAVRLLVDTVGDCYAALGIVHNLWSYIPGEFDDYIANPKLNMYQSIHTAVVGPEGKPLEIQIRTRDMHQHAEFGVAAHWRYKESTKHDADFERRIVWMRHWLELKDEGGEACVSDRLGAEMEPALVYVFTPRARSSSCPGYSTTWRKPVTAWRWSS